MMEVFDQVRGGRDMGSRRKGLVKLGMNTVVGEKGALLGGLMLRVVIGKLCEG